MLTITKPREVVLPELDATYVTVGRCNHDYVWTFDRELPIWSRWIGQLKDYKHTPATLVLSVANYLPYVPQKNVIRATARKTISRELLREAGLLCFGNGGAGFAGENIDHYYADPSRETKMLESFDKLVRIAGLNVEKDERAKFLSLN